MIKRPRDEENHEKDERRKKFKADHFNLSILHVPELVEKIIKSTIEYPTTILSIAMVSRMHYSIVHNKSIWVELGYSPNISEEEHLPHKVLMVLLTQIRLLRQTKKLNEFKREINALKKISKEAAKDIHRDLDPEEYPQFVANTILTAEAAKVLLKLITKTKARPFDLLELVDWLEMPLDHKREPEQFTKEFQFPDQKYPYLVQWAYYKDPVGLSRMTHILTMWTDDDPYELDMYRYPMADPNKSLMFFSFTKNSLFIKLNKSTNRIEYCGDFDIYVARKFNGNYDAALTFLCEEDGSLKYDAWGEVFLFTLHTLQKNLKSVASGDSVLENIQFRK